MCALVILITALLVLLSSLLLLSLSFLARNSLPSPHVGSARVRYAVLWQWRRALAGATKPGAGNGAADPDSAGGGVASGDGVSVSVALCPVRWLPEQHLVRGVFV